MEIYSWTQVHGPQVKLLRQLRKIEYTLIYKHHLAKMEEKRNLLRPFREDLIFFKVKEYYFMDFSGFSTVY